MLQLGSIRAVDCGRVSRRAVLGVGSIGVIGLSLADLIKLRAAAAAESSPRAKSIILLWLWGGPSHLDTLDMKPKAPVQYRGPYAPIATSVPGIQICELLPHLARRADRYSIIRSLHSSSNDHGIAGTIGLTGSESGGASLGGQVQPGRVKPAHGSIVSKVLGFAPAMPRFVTLGGRLHQGKRPITGEGGGPLGSLHDPFRLDYDPVEGVKLPQLDLPEGYTAEGLSGRRSLRESLDEVARRFDRWPQMERLDQFRQQAFSLLTSSSARQVFDLEQEPVELRARYGRFRFGQCCLMARRLVEAGVRLVQVNWSSHVEPVEDTGDGGWDMHDRNFQQLQDRHAWMLDQSLSALLDDLDQRGLLRETIVVAVGEFGRTPKINEKAGRDHWQQCYAALVAGGGLKIGQVIGESDAKGEFPASHPVTPADLFHTLLAQIGIGTTQLTAAGITPQGEVIDELM
jgi:uncharacterized protein (DUF1501 family)